MDGDIRGSLGKQHCFKDNGANILVVAHLDTVIDTNHFAEAKITGETIYYNPKLDDRLGAYTILDILPRLDVMVDILFTENEEMGMSTAGDFKTDKKYNWIVEFDRKGDDVVSYNYDFEDVLLGYFEVGLGAFSDISALEHLGCKGFNVGVGYHREHFMDSFMKLTEFVSQIARFMIFYNDNRNTYYPHEESDYSWQPIYNSNIDHQESDTIPDWKDEKGIFSNKKCTLHDLGAEWEDRELWCVECGTWKTLDEADIDEQEFFRCPVCQECLVE